MKRNIVIATVTVAALAGGGTAAAFASGDDGAPATRASNAQVADDNAQDDGVRQDDAQDDDATRAASAKVTAAEAISTALRHTSGTAVSAGLDDDDDGSVAWEVDVLAKNNAWHSVRIDPANGKVLSSHAEHEDDTAQVRAALKGASTSAAQAAKAAAAKGKVTSVDLDEDGASKSWQAETRSADGAEHDWVIDLRTGKVTADHSDDD